MQTITHNLEVRIERVEGEYCYIWIGTKSGKMLGHTSKPLKKDSAFKETPVTLFFQDSAHYKLQTNERGEFKILG